MNSSLWNIEELLILSNENSSDSNCTEAEDFLFTTWTMDLLNAIYICNDAEKGSKLFAFNPYKNQAPKPWKIRKIKSGLYDHPWTLLEQPYSLIESKKQKKSTFTMEQTMICQSLTFDRSNDCGKYPVRVGMYQNLPFFHLDAVNDKPKMSGIDYDFNYFSLERLNLTIVPFLFNGSKNVTHIDNKTGNVYHLLGNISTGQKDLLLFSIGMMNISNIRYSNAFIPVGITTLSLKYHYSTSEYFVKSGPLLLYLLFLTIGLFIVGFFHLKSKSHPKNVNILMMIEIIFSLPMEISPKKFAIRIIVFGIVIFFVIINIIVPGNLKASFVIKEEGQNVEKLSDLNSLQYRVFSPKIIMKYFDFGDIDNVIVMDPFVSCTNLIVTKNDACFHYDISLKTISNYENKYHIPELALMPMLKSYLFRRDLPQFAKIAEIHGRLMSSGITTRWLDKMDDKQKKKNLKNATSWNALNLHDLKLALLVLIAGFILSIIVYIAEIIMWKLNCRKAKLMNVQ